MAKRKKSKVRLTGHRFSQAELEFDLVLILFISTFF